MDLSTILGLALAFGAMCLGIILEHGHLGAYVGLSAAVIIFGGTFGALTVSFPFSTLFKLPRLLTISFTSHAHDVGGIIQALRSYAEKARREGVLSLEAEATSVPDEFMKKGLRLVVDGTEPALLRDILATKISSMDERHHEGAQIFETAGGFAPTMGIIGTILGLINVLSNLSEPEKLGGHIALAFIATLYGVGSANVFWLPVASKLKMRHKEEKLIKELMLEGIISIQAGDNPRVLEEKLRSFLSPSESDKIVLKQ